MRSGAGAASQSSRTSSIIIQFADQLDALIVTNDRSKDYAEQYPWVHDRRLPYMIVKGEVVLYDEQQWDGGS